MHYLNGILLIIAAYLIGSFPTGLIIGKTFYNIDIREHGSGNLGGSNAMRVLGKKGGFACYIIDILKGGITVLLAMHFSTSFHPLIIALFALVGHLYPVFAGFRGGKAVASSAGIILFYSPITFIVLAVVFFGSLLTTKMISLSSTLTAIALFITVWWNPFNDATVEGFVPRLIFTLIVLVIIVKHRSNYKRILNKTEPKVFQKKA